MFLLRTRVLFFLKIKGGVCCTTNSSCEVAHPPPESRQTWGRNNSRQTQESVILPLFESTPLPSAHQWESRRYEWAIGWVLGALQAEQKVTLCRTEELWDSTSRLLVRRLHFQSVSWRNPVQQAKPCWGIGPLLVFAGSVDQTRVPASCFWHVWWWVCVLGHAVQKTKGQSHLVLVGLRSC